MKLHCFLSTYSCFSMVKCYKMYYISKYSISTHICRSFKIIRICEFKIDLNHPKQWMKDLNPLAVVDYFITLNYSTFKIKYLKVFSCEMYFSCLKIAWIATLHLSFIKYTQNMNIHISPASIHSHSAFQTSFCTHVSSVNGSFMKKIRKVYCVPIFLLILWPKSMLPTVLVMKLYTF